MTGGTYKNQVDKKEMMRMRSRPNCYVMRIRNLQSSTN